MTRVILIVSFVLLFAFFVFANGPVAPAPEDVSFGSTEPMLHPWATDLVSWTTAASLSQYQYRTANGTIGNWFYCFGEQNNPYANAYNYITNSWSPSTPPILGNCNWCGVPTNDALYIVGRYSGAYGNEVQKFVPTGGGPTGTWSLMAPYPVAGCGIAAAWDGGDLIYAAGGNPSLSNAYKYSISANTWTPIASLPVQRSYCGGWVADGKFCVYGGTVAGVSNTIVVYDPGTNTWSNGANLPTAVWFSTFSTTGNSQYLFSVGGGGGYGTWPATDAVQIYDPDLNSWSLETSLPVAHGLNSAGVTVDGEVCSAGGYLTTYDCFYGTGFPTAGPPPVHDIEVALTPYSTPIQIPANGGTFEFNVELTNNETQPVNLSAWTMVTLPNGSEYGPILNVPLTLGASASVNRDRIQNVPANAPTGDYVYHAYVGIYPNTVWDEDSFDFEKLAVDGVGHEVIGWHNGGDNFEFVNGPVAPAPEDVSFGSTEPMTHPWATDLVSWTTAASLSQYQYRTANGTIGNWFYMFGEQNNPYANAYNYTTNSWSPSTPPILGNCNWCGVPTNDALYIVGRYSGSYGNEVQKFVPTGGGPTGTWSLVANYPVAGCGIAAAWDGGDLIYAAGGNPSLSNAYKYSISANTWTPIASLPVQRSYCGGWVADGKFCVYGGTVAGVSNTIVVYDPGTNTWSNGANLPTAVWFSTFSTTGNSQYLFSVGGGGGYGTWPATDAVQIYDPDLNSWSLETSLPVAHGLNGAGVTVDGEVCSAGGYLTTYDCFYGTGFPTAGPPPVHDIEVALTPYSTPIQIPANGGTFEFNVELTNNETQPVNLSAWTMVTLPNGSEYGPILNVPLTLGASASVNRDRIQNVPANAPTGDYVYHAYVGIYPNNIWDEDSFDFEKLAVDNGGGFVYGWTNTGEDFGETLNASAATVESYALHSAYPNPFNPSTTIAYDLKEATNVKLVVFDITGREVATLVDGWMSQGVHNAVFNAANLASGVYFYHLNAGDFSATKKMILMK